MTATERVKPGLRNGVRSTDMMVPQRLEGDYPPVPVRKYVPEGAADDAVLPILIYFHGGGMVIQSEQQASACAVSLPELCASCR